MNEKRKTHIFQKQISILLHVTQSSFIKLIFISRLYHARPICNTEHVIDSLYIGYDDVSRFAVQLIIRCEGYYFLGCLSHKENF
ncbi:unnamed protein product [Auanema sp. JU1783]|nr:unnamed protein product [Auanema sp. JU1783]